MSKPIASYSPARRAGNTVYCSGQIPLLPETGELLQASLTLLGNVVLALAALQLKRRAAT